MYMYLICLDTFKAEVERLSISESYQKSGLEESEHLTHSGKIQVTKINC